jgi:predicted amidophosphoribosyltransferase
LPSSTTRVVYSSASAAWEKANDKAFVKAQEEILPKFVQCPRCSAWVCREHYRNEKKGLCKECAPDLGVQMATAQASKSVEEVWVHARMSEEDKHLNEADWREVIVASCPNCGAPQATNARFCAQCGTDLKAARLCTQCGARLQPGARFCNECGAPVG